MSIKSIRTIVNTIGLILMYKIPSLPAMSYRIHILRHNFSGLDQDRKKYEAFETFFDTFTTKSKEN